MLGVETTQPIVPPMFFFSSVLVCHELWWNTPEWLRLPSTNWPTKPSLPSESPDEEETDIRLKHDR